MPLFSDRQFLTFLVGLLMAVNCSGQTAFPVRIDRLWGLMDTSGQLVVPANYEAIGEFNDYGYAVMQRESKVGLINDKGHEIVTAKFDDIKVLDSTRFAALSSIGWSVRNLAEDIILPPGYEDVIALPRGLLAYQRDDQWGVVDRQGLDVLKRDYQAIVWDQAGYLRIKKNENWGLAGLKGEIILPPVAQEICVHSDKLILYNQSGHWGGVGLLGKSLFPARYTTIKKLDDRLLMLYRTEDAAIFSLDCHTLLKVDPGQTYYPYSDRAVLVKHNRRMGLIGFCGQKILPIEFHEIQTFGEKLFRVNKDALWGLYQPGGKVLLMPEMDYIAPLANEVAIIKKGGQYGLINNKGQVIVSPDYARIIIEGRKAKAYQQAVNEQSESVAVFQWDEHGQLTGGQDLTEHFVLKVGSSTQIQPQSATNNRYQLDKYEWFYSPKKDRWGLRRLADGSLQIEPIFDEIQLIAQAGFTLVGMHTTTRYDFEHTTYRFDKAYGLVQNESGLLISEITFLHVWLDDFVEGQSVARVLFTNGQFGLIDRQGTIVKRGLAFIDDWKYGRARAALGKGIDASIHTNEPCGSLKAFLQDLYASSRPVDYTEYDQLFHQTAQLSIPDGHWGYLDNQGEWIGNAEFDFARPMRNGIGIVRKGNKWGAVDPHGRLKIPCRYDELEFLPHTEGKMLRLFVRQPRVGLIDTLGRLTVHTQYDELGDFKEKRLAVQREDRWGFVDEMGREVIPCRFKKVKPFNNGLAAVKIGRYWGFIDQVGTVVIGMKYHEAGNFQDDLAWVDTHEGYGYINSKGEMKIPSQYEDALDFQDGIAVVKSDGKYGLIDTSGHYLLRPKYAFIQPFDQYGLAIVRYGSKRHKYGLINRAGNLVSSQSFQSIGPFQQGLAVVKTERGYGYINIQAEVVIPTLYSKASPFYEGRAAVRKGGACGYITLNGNALTDFQFTQCENFVDGRAVVYDGIRNAGLIDLDGRFILEPNIDRMLNFSNGMGLVRDSRYRFYYITERSDVHRGYYEQAGAFQHGVAVVQTGGKWGIINQRGIQLIPAKYDHIDNFRDGYAKVIIEGFNGLSKLDGSLLADPNYEFITYVGKGLFRVEKDNRMGYVNRKGVWVWDLTQ